MTTPARPAPARPDGQRLDGQHANGQRADGQRADGQHADEGRTDRDGAGRPEPERREHEPATSPAPAEQNRRIVVERKVRRFDSRRSRWQPRAHITLVIMTAGGRYEVISPDDQLTVGELFWKRIRTVYEVDIGEHQATFDDELPSKGDAFRFLATTDLRWWVDDPLKIVRRYITDTDGLLRAVRPKALERMRWITRRYDVTESAQAERALNDEFTARPLGTDTGLTIEAFVRLSLEAATREHASTMINIGRQAEIEESAQQLRRRQEANRRELMAERMAAYREVIAAGDIEQFALQLAQNPEEIGKVMEDVRADRDKGRRHAIEFFTQLTESGLVERYEIDDVIRTTLDWLNESVTKVLPDKAPIDLPGGRNRARRDPIPSPLSDGSGSGDRAESPEAPPALRPPPERHG